MPAHNKISPSYQPTRRQLGAVLPLDTPYVVYLDASERCNFKCRYCFRGNPTDRDDFYCYSNALMEWKTFTRAVEQLKEFPGRVGKVSLSTHGEPLCNPALPEMARYIKRSNLGCFTEIHTNAALLDAEKALRLAEAGLDRIIISVQGLHAKKYRQMCGVEIDFSEFIGNIEILYRNKPAATLIYVKVLDLALEPGQEQVFYDLFGRVADRVFIESAVPLWKNSPDRSRRADSVSLNKFGRKIPYQHCCSLAFYCLVVAPDGTIYPCTQPEISFDLGNIFKTNLQRAWNSPERTNFLKQHLRAGRATLLDCVDCYIAQNSIQADEDSINAWRDDIYQRLTKK